MALSHRHNQSTTDKVAYEHPAIFPEQLAADHIISWSNEGDIVFDPFCGSGTTCKMAVLNNRNYLGIEISQGYCDIACKRIEEAKNTNMNYIGWEQNDEYFDVAQKRLKC